MKRLNKPGDSYNMLTLVAFHERRNGGNKWLVRCDCGKERVIAVRDVVSGHTRSCGCQTSAMKRASKMHHGMSESAEYRIWCHMLGRCENPTDRKYPWYGARGITVGQRWQKFEAFYADMGPRPTRFHSIDRIDNDRGYEPGNCRWATTFEQARNKRSNVFVTVGGFPFVIAEAERLLGASYGSINQRARKNGETNQEAADHFAARLAAMLGNTSGGQQAAA